ETAAALDGARAILAERFAEDADLIGELRERMWVRGRLVSRVRDGKQEAGAKFADYFDFTEPFTRLPSHRILALFRGENEEILDLTFAPQEASEPEAGPGAYEQEMARRVGIAEAGRPGTVPYDTRRPRRSGIAEAGRPADGWLLEPVRWAWRTRVLTRLAVDL